MNAELAPILTKFNLPEVHGITPLSVGLLHKTYFIETHGGDFILQALHPVLASNEIGEDFKAVTKYLKKQDFYAPKLVVNRGGKTLTKMDDSVWRMQTAIKGVTHDVVKSTHMAKSAGGILARFHKALANIDYEFKTNLVLHETKKEYQKLIDAAALHPDLLPAVQAEYDFLIDELPKLFLPEKLPVRVTHGDPKISNILFDGFENAISMIDLDTCNRGSVLSDLGDAMRSWCGGKEDDPNNVFKQHVYDAAVEGYLAEADFLTAKEKRLIPNAVGAITLELSARFLADYFNDTYFGWDEAHYGSRREHNLARSRGQIALYKDFKEKTGL